MLKSETAAMLSRIDTLLVATGKSDRQASIEATGKAHTIRNMRTGSTPAVDVVERLAAALGVSPGYLAFGTEENPGPARSAPALPPPASIPLIGLVGAGAFLAVDTDVDAPLFDDAPIPPDPSYDIADQFAVQVSGTSVNRVAPDGAILGCIDVVKTRRQPRQGDLVIVERQVFSGQAIERTAKRFHKVEGGFELRPDSDDPRHQQPIRISSTDEPAEGESVRVIGIVTWLHAPMRSLDRSRRV